MEAAKKSRKGPSHCTNIGQLCCVANVFLALVTIAVSFATFIVIGKTENIGSMETYSANTKNISSGVTNLLTDIDKALQYIVSNPNTSLAVSLFNSSVSDDSYKAQFITFKE